MKKFNTIKLIGVLSIITVMSIGFYYNLSDNHSKTIPDAASYGKKVYGKDGVNSSGFWTLVATSIHTKSACGGSATYERNDTGWLYYIGGDTNFLGGITARTECYNTVQNSWQREAPCPTKIQYTGCAIIKNTIFIIGGMKNTNFNSETDSVFKYKITTNTWVPVAVLPRVIACNKAAGYQDSLIYSAGGVSDTGSISVSDVYLYNAAVNQWRAASPLPAPLMGGAFTAYGDTLYYIGGGSTYFGPYTDTVYQGIISQTDRSQISWTMIAPYPGQARWRFDAEPWGNSGIIVGAGCGNTTFGSSNECYTLCANVWTQQYNIIYPMGSAAVGSVQYSTGIGKFFVGSGEQYPDTPFTFSYMQIFTDTVVHMPLPNYPCEGFTRSAFPPTGWNYMQQNGDWISRASVSGFGLGSGSMMFDYYDAPAGYVGNIRTITFYPTVDGDSLLFDLAYCPLGPYDSLLIYSSTDGGVTFTTVFSKGGAQLQTDSGCSRPFVPTASSWIRTGAPLPPQTDKILFQAYCGFGDNLYLDSICIHHPVGINKKNQVPLTYSLSQNYPNPFNPSTLIKYSLPKAGNVELKVYDILGREVMTLVNEFKQPGSYSVQFNANNYASGVYFYKLKAGDFVATKKMLLLK